jgi:hypothetical protein
VLPPGGRRTSSDVGSTTIVEIAAQLNHFTDRPDLFLEAIEKHDPGFIKKMNAKLRVFLEQAEMRGSDLAKRRHTPRWA